MKATDKPTEFRVPDGYSQPPNRPHFTMVGNEFLEWLPEEGLYRQTGKVPEATGSANIITFYEGYTVMTQYAPDHPIWGTPMGPIPLAKQFGLENYRWVLLDIEEGTFKDYPTKPTGTIFLDETDE